MKEYYLQRLHWIFNYTGKKWWYCIVKTLCLVVGVPIYAVSFAVEMVLTAINMIFSWIPILNVVVTVICKALITVFGATFYICILPDIKKYKQATKDEVTCEPVEDVALPEADEPTETTDASQDNPDDTSQD